MYINNFQRVEEKYVIKKEDKEKLLKVINSYIKKDEYFKSEIHNIYFDTKNNDLIINSLEKPIYKDKFRIRSYGIPKYNDYVFLEMKTKYKGVVGKRRIKIRLNEIDDYLENNKETDNEILKEIIYYYKYYKLKKAIYIAYDRESYKGILDNNLRITFDSNLRSRRNDLYFKEDDMIKYFDEDYYIMEIKTIGALPLWLARSLSELKIYPISFSKYGKIYEREMKEMIKYA